jgi:hypothetical protein
MVTSALGAGTGAQLARARAEYDEMPGLCLTSTQFCRLLGVSAATAEALILALIDEGFLRQTKFGYRKVEWR